MNLSQRTAWETRTNPYTRAVHTAQASGKPLLDLTQSNPVQAGFQYSDAFYQAITKQAAAYEPDPMGALEARTAIAHYYAQKGAHVLPQHLWLGAGTSELYAHLMWLLCDPGDTFAVPVPGYPLFESVARLCQVDLVHYPLRYDQDWHVDLPALRAILEGPRPPRALVLISPHNPTGHRLSAAEWNAINAACAASNTTIILDEVFADYPLHDQAAPAYASDTTLLCRLSGLSKVAALPQYKVSWCAVTGPEEKTELLIERAAFLSDTFLNASPILQAAVPDTLHQAEAMQARIRNHCRTNYQHARQVLAQSCVSLLKADGGWTALLRMPATQSDEAWAIELMHTQGILTQPGYLYDLPVTCNSPLLAISLLTPEKSFGQAISRIASLA